MRELEELFKRKRIRFNLGKEVTRRVLVLAPHADDETIGCGGTILKLLEENWIIEVVLFCHKTDDERRNEFTKAREHLGYQGVHYLGGVDGGLIEQVNHMSRSLSAIINDVCPNMIFTPYILDQVEDHHAVNMCLAYALGNVDVDKEIAVYMYEVWNFIQCPDYYIDITELFEKKKQILMKYQSQEDKYQICNKSECINSLRAQLSFRRNYKYTECFRKISSHEFTRSFQILYKDSEKG